MKNSNFLIRNSVEFTIPERYKSVDSNGSSHAPRISYLRLDSNKKIGIVNNSDISETVVNLIPEWVSGQSFQQLHKLVKYLGKCYKYNQLNGSGFNNTTPPLGYNAFYSPVQVSEIESSMIIQQTVNSGLLMGDTSTLGTTEYTKYLNIYGINNITYYILRSPTITNIQDDYKTNIFKTVTTTHFDHSSQFRYENYPRLFTITYPYDGYSWSTRNDGGPIQCWLDLSKCKNLLTIDIGGDFYVVQTYRINNFKIPELPTLRVFRITDVSSSNIYNWFQIDTNINLDFSLYTELVVFAYAYTQWDDNRSLYFTRLNGLTLPQTNSKLLTFECGISNFTSLDMTTSPLLTSFIFKDNNFLTLINLSMCQNLVTVRINVTNGYINLSNGCSILNILSLPTTMNSLTTFRISTLPALTSITLPTSTPLLNACYINNTGLTSIVFNSNVASVCVISIQSNLNLATIDLSLVTNVAQLYISSDSTLTNFSMPTTHTNLLELWFFSTGVSTFTYNSNTSSGSQYYYNNPLLTTIINFPTGGTNVIFDSNALLNNSNNIWDLILATNRSNLCIRNCVSFISTNTDLSLMTSLTQYRSSGINISGNYILPSTNVMTKFAASNILSLNRLPTTLQTLHITSSASLTTLPSIPSTLWGIYIENSGITGHLNLSVMSTTSFVGLNTSQIYITGNSNITEITLPITPRSIMYNIDIRMAGLFADAGVGNGLAIINCPNITTINNLVGVNHDLKQNGSIQPYIYFTNTGLNLEIPFGKAGNTNLLPVSIYLNNMPNMTLINLYLSLKNIYTNKNLWYDYNSGNGTNTSKIVNLNNTIITTKITKTPFGYVQGVYHLTTPTIAINGYVFLETWINGITYPINNVVEYLGSYYIRILISDDIISPDINITDWILYTLTINDTAYNTAMREMKHILGSQRSHTSNTNLLKYYFNVTL